MAQEAEEWFLEKDSESLVERLGAQRSRQLKAETPVEEGKIRGATKIRILFFSQSTVAYSPEEENRLSEKPQLTLNVSRQKGRPKPRAPLRGERWA